MNATKWHLTPWNLLREQQKPVKDIELNAQSNIQ